MGEAKVKRGRPAKAKTPLPMYEMGSILSQDADGNVSHVQLYQTPQPKPHRRTLTIPKPQTVAKAKQQADIDQKLKQLLKAISRDGALGNDRSLIADVDAIKELFT